MTSRAAIPRTTATCLGAALLAFGLAGAACATGGSAHKTRVAPRAAVETVTVRDPELEQRAARLQLHLLEDEAQLEDMQTRLDDARQQVVRAMAKLQTFATRAEAASGMAEAKIAFDSLKAAAGQQTLPEVGQTARLLQMSSTEFDKQNYGGALYLANQAKGVAAMGQGRLSSGDRGGLRPGEVAFVLPLQLQTVGNGKVRDGPGTGFKTLFTLEAGSTLVAYSYLETWVHVRDDTGRSGWIHYSLVGRRQDTK